MKNIKLHFELLTKSPLILEILFYLFPIPLEEHQEKTSLIFFFFFGDPLKKISLHYNQILLSAFVFLSCIY